MYKHTLILCVLAVFVSVLLIQVVDDFRNLFLRLYLPNQSIVVGTQMFAVVCHDLEFCFAGNRKSRTGTWELLCR